MLACPNCKNLVEAEAVFCDRCGYPLGKHPGNPVPRSNSLENHPSTGFKPVSSFISAGGARPGTCSACGFVNMPGEMFCQNCGVQLPPVASAPPPLPQRVIDPNALASPEQKNVLTGSSDQDTIARSGTPAVAEPFVTLEIKGNEGQARFSLRSGEILIGRLDPVLAIYPDLDTTPFGGDARGVSRRHARIVRRNEIYFVEDLNSTNFTFLNDDKLEPGRLYPLADGDEIRLGLLALIYHSSIGQ